MAIHACRIWSIMQQKPNVKCTNKLKTKKSTFIYLPNESTRYKRSSKINNEQRVQITPCTTTTTIYWTVTVIRWQTRMVICFRRMRARCHVLTIWANFKILSIRWIRTTLICQQVTKVRQIDWRPYPTRRLKCLRVLWTLELPNRIRISKQWTNQIV